MCDGELKYTAKNIKEIEIKPGCWKHSLIGIFKDNLQIGEYERNYPSLGETTFYPFLLNGKEYALYSKHYMYTRIMSLPNCKDLFGEDDSNTEYKNHFCPAEYYVPIICAQNYPPNSYPHTPRHDPEKWATTKISPDGFKYYDWTKADKNQEYIDACKKADIDFKEWQKKYPFEYSYLPLGFIAGCAWGNDSSLNIECIDLQKSLQNKQLIRDNRFGNIELPHNVKLKNAIDCDGVDNIQDLKYSFIEIAVNKPFRLNGDPIND